MNWRAFLHDLAVFARVVAFSVALAVVLTVVYYLTRFLISQ